MWVRFTAPLISRPTLKPCASVLTSAKEQGYILYFEDAFHAVKLIGTLADPRALPQLVNELNQKPLQIIFPRPVSRLRANPEYIDRARSKALAGNLTGKHVVGSLGGAAATIAVPNAMRLRGRGDVMGSGAVATGGGIAVKQMDEAAGDAFMLTGLGMTGLKAVK